MQIYLKTPEELAIMREAGRIVARAHEEMRKALRPGISTWELDRIAETVIRDHGATPAFLNYPKPDSPPFPATINASINDELVHGIPSKDRLVLEGDIISLDTGCHYQGFVGDAAYTWIVGDVSPAVKRLVETTEGALYAAIEACVLPNTVKDVARATQNHAEKHGYSVAREYTGHGVGRAMHEDPQVPNWWPKKKHKRLEAQNAPLRPGMTFAIEPMLIAGKPELMELEDQWTVVTRDGSLCAHFEHTVAITDDKPIILTLL
ncbi:MAG: type I methionyl aminopeptidase [Anaerolineae bacterium]